MYIFAEKFRHSKSIHTKMRTTILTSALLSIFWLSSCGGNVESKEQNTVQATATSGTETVESSASSPGNTGTPIYLTKAEFIAKVYDYEKNPNQWVYKGSKPCIIDFYADWCKPCKMIAPILADLAKQYEGKIDVYKINTDQERELAQAFNIRSIPTILFCPVDGQPQMTQGALPKETFEKVIQDVLLKK